MIDGVEFKKRWNKDVFPLNKYIPSKVEQLKIDEKNKAFLLIAGLPDSAAPFLTFEKDEKGGLSKLNELYKIEGIYGQYVYLGYKASGDFVVLNESDGKIICIDHETFEEQYINNSIIQMAESLLEYADFINRIKQVNGRRAYLNREAPIEELEMIKNKLLNIDKDVFQNKSFWEEEMEQFEFN